MSRPDGTARNPRALALDAWRRLCEQEQRQAARPVTRENRLDAERRLQALRREAATVDVEVARCRPESGGAPTAGAARVWSRGVLPVVIAGDLASLLELPSRA